jgi:hypothetical protein
MRMREDLADRRRQVTLVFILGFERLHLAQGWADDEARRWRAGVLDDSRAQYRSANRARSDQWGS